MHNCQTCEGLSDDCFHARCDSVVHALCYAERMSVCLCTSELKS